MPTSEFFLHATRQADLKQMQTLAEQYGDEFLHAIDRFTGDTHGHIVARGGHLGILRWLAELQSIVEMEAVNFLGNTLVHEAALWGHGATVQWLYENKFQVFRKNYKHLTPVHHAASGGHLPVLQWFYGIEPNCIHLKDHRGNTVLHYGASKGNKRVLQWLVQVGAKVHTVSSKGHALIHSAALGGNKETLKWCLDMGFDINIHDRNGQTPAHCAAQNNHVSALVWISIHGGRVDIPDRNGHTALELLAQQTPDALQQYQRLMSRLGATSSKSLWSKWYQSKPSHPHKELKKPHPTASHHDVKLIQKQLVKALFQEQITSYSIAQSYLEQHFADQFATVLQHLDISSVELAHVLAGKAYLMLSSTASSRNQ